MAEPDDAKRVGLAPVVLTGLVVTMFFFVGFGVWSGMAPLDSAAVAPGVVTIDTNRKTVQHLEGGIVARILVREGDHVGAGQVLVQLDDVQARARLEQLQAVHRALSALAARLAAERDSAEGIAFPDWLVAERSDPKIAAILRNQVNVFEAHDRALAGQVLILEQQIAQSQEEIHGLREQIIAEEEQLELLDEEIADKQTLLDKGLIDKPRVLALKRRHAELRGSRGRNKASIARVLKSIGETRIRMAELETSRINDAVDQFQEVENRIFELEKQLRAAEDVLRRTEIRAPLTGTVVGLKVHSPGGVITPGEPLMDVVPSEERLLIDAQISPDDIDVVFPGLKAQVRLTALPQRHASPLEGRLLSVSADSLLDERSGQSYYLGRVELSDLATDLGSDEIQPGMQAQVMILTGKNTLLDYLLRPVSRTLERGLRED